MSLSLNPSTLYDVASARPQPAGGHGQGFVDKRGLVDNKVLSSVRQTGESRAQQRSEDYVAALRELRAQNHEARSHQAAQTYLDIAHFEGNFHLINVYA